MTENKVWNFSQRLVNRLGPNSCLIDASTGQIVGSSDLSSLIPNWGAGLMAAGLKRHDRLIICCDLSYLSSLVYLGTMYAGIVAVPVEKHTLNTFGEVLFNKTGAKAIWSKEDVKFDWIHKKDVLCLSGDISQKSTEKFPLQSCEENDIAVLVTTSGSTGIPRFVMVSHGNLIANTEAIIRSQFLKHDERAMLILPISYCFGASILHTHLYQGGGIVLDNRFMFPDKVLHAINTFRCTTFAGVPTIYNILLSRSNIRTIHMPKLRRFLQAGGPLSPQNISAMCSILPTADFYVMYGQTEATARISCLDPSHLNEKLGSVGQALDNLTVRIMDENGHELPQGKTGEIWVKGPSITHGYLGEPEETCNVFHDGWLRTRDMAYIDEDGYIWIQGRKGNFLKMRGVRVSFAEVEARVGSVAGVFECAATAVSHPEAGEALALFVVPEKDEDHVIEKVRSSLPTHWTCESIKVVSEIPKTPNGKIARALLQSLQ